VLDHRTVPHVDPFSFSMSGAPWVAHEWLSEVLIALAWRIGGWNGLILLFAAVTGLTLGLLALHLERWLARMPAMLVLLLVGACMAPSLLARPHVLVLPVMEVWTVGLLSARMRDTAPSLLLLPLMVAWANMHGSFIFGLALIGPLAMEALLAAGASWPKALRGWAMFALASIAAALATPYFWRGLLFPIQLMRLQHLGNINEWQPPDFRTFQPIELALMALLYCGFTRGLRVPVFRLLSGMALLHLALQHERHQMLAGIVGALLLAESLGDTFGRATPAVPPAAEATWFGIRPWNIVAFALVAGLIAFRAVEPVTRDDDLASPITALAHVPAEIAATPVLNDYSFGGYLIFKGVRPFIDARADMYGDRFLSTYSAAMRPEGAAAFKQIVSTYGVRWTILGARSPALTYLDTLPGWRRIYADSVAVVHVRTDPP
jgi:hypothetical protein